MNTKQTIATHINSVVIKSVQEHCLGKLNADQTARCVGVALDALERGRSADNAIRKAMTRAARVRAAWLAGAV